MVLHFFQIGLYSLLQVGFKDLGGGKRDIDPGLSPIAEVLSVSSATYSTKEPTLFQGNLKLKQCPVQEWFNFPLTRSTRTVD